MSEAIVDGLLGFWVDTAGDPNRVGRLYEVLREYCHTFRNHLNGLRLSLYLARRPAEGEQVSRWDDLERESRRIEALLDQVQEICKPMPLHPIRYALGAALEERGPTWVEWLSAAGRPLDWDRPVDPALGWFDPTRLIRALDALAAWRAEAGEPGTPVRLGWRRDDDWLEVEWSEPNSTRLEPPNWAANQPISLALPLIARVMTAHDGKLTVHRDRGVRFVLRWPVVPAVEPVEADSPHPI